MESVLFCLTVLFMRGSERSKLCASPQFLFLFGARATDKKPDKAAAAMHSFVVKI